MLVLFYNDLGLGYTGIKTCTVLGIKVLHLKTFQNKESKISLIRRANAIRVMRHAANVIREYYSELDTTMYHLTFVSC